MLDAMSIMVVWSEPVLNKQRRNLTELPNSCFDLTGFFVRFSFGVFKVIDVVVTTGWTAELNTE